MQCERKKEFNYVGSRGTGNNDDFQLCASLKCGAVFVQTYI